MEKFILALDQGTSSSRAILFDHSGAIRRIAQRELPQYYPHPGWVEQDPREIWSTQLDAVSEVLAKSGIRSGNIAAIGITNQRETTIVWDRETGEPVYQAIVWQDRRTAEFCSSLAAKGLSETIQKETGLVIDAYFSATKLRWILDNIPAARENAQAGKLAFGTVDSWLIWNLTGGAKHLTDVSNASRTMLFNIHTMQWDTEILKLLEIPAEVLPVVYSSSEIYGDTSERFFGSAMRVAANVGDQQAALFGQACLHPGMLKNTYGTGAFLVFNTGTQPVLSENKLLTTIAWKLNGETQYALEGSIFVAGAVVQWLRDGLGVIRNSSEIETLARSVTDNGGVYFVPAFVGLGAPHWDQYARGLIIGLTRGTTAGHIARAALESIAFQSMDVLKLMEKDSGIAVSELRVDGGAAMNDLLMQFQSDIAGIPLVRPQISETTALGAAYLAGLSVGYWKDLQEIESHWKPEKRFTPQMDPQLASQLLADWKKAVSRSKAWLHP